MNEHLSETRINDYLDGVLGAADHADLEAHVRVCASCHNEVEATRQLLAALHALPQGIAPERDLLPGIHQAIDREQVVALEGWRSRSLWSMRWAVATAAVLLVMATAVITQVVAKKQQTRSVALPTAVHNTLVSQQLNQLEGKYENAIAELQQLIEAQRSELAPSTLQLLEHNLRVIDAAIRESRAALQQDPANDLVNEMLWSAYEKKLELLRRVTTIST